MTTRTTKWTMAMATVAAGMLTACGGNGAKGSDDAVPARISSASIGAAGGQLATAAGVTLTFPAGALSSEVEIRVVEPARREGEPRRIQLEPAGLVLSAPAHVRVKAEDGNAHDERLVEIEHVGGHELEHGLEAEQENEVEHAREVEVHHLGELELREARTCDVACGAGFECDDGVCKDHPEDPAPIGTTVGPCPAGQERDVSDGVCKPHGGGNP